MAKTIDSGTLQVQTRRSQALAQLHRNPYESRAVRGVPQGEGDDMGLEESIVPQANMRDRYHTVEARRRQFWRRIAIFIRLRNAREAMQGEERGEIEGRGSTSTD